MNERDLSIASINLTWAGKDIHAAYHMGAGYGRDSLIRTAMEGIHAAVNALGYQLIKTQPEASMGTSNIEESQCPSQTSPATECVS